jgi:hypothetical protein
MRSLALTVRYREPAHALFHVRGLGHARERHRRPAARGAQECARTCCARPGRACCARPGRACCARPGRACCVRPRRARRVWCARGPRRRRHAGAAGREDGGALYTAAAAVDTPLHEQRQLGARATPWPSRARARRGQSWRLPTGSSTRLRTRSTRSTRSWRTRSGLRARATRPCPLLSAWGDSASLGAYSASASGPACTGHTPPADARLASTLWTVHRRRCQTYFLGDRLRAINRSRNLSGQIKQREKLIFAGMPQRLKARHHGRRMLNRSARDHRSVAYAFERRGTSNAVDRESSDVHNCFPATTMTLRKMLSFNVSFLDLFPAPPTHTMRRNSSLETIVPGRHNNLRAALPACDVQDCSVAPPCATSLPLGQPWTEEEIRELESELVHWTVLRVIQPGGLNHKYVHSTSLDTLSLTHCRLATILLSLYRVPHPLLGHACGHNTPSARRTERPFVIVAGVDILQYLQYSSWDEAAARLLAFAPIVSFYNCVAARKPVWIVHLGPHTLENFVYIGDTVYVDHGGYYAGGVVSDVFLERWACDLLGFLRCLVEGAWMNDKPGGGNGDEFYLLVHQDWCLRKARAVYPMRWIISDLDHSSVDPDFQDGAFLCHRSARRDNLIIAQNGCQHTSESGRSRHCWIDDEATSAYPLRRGLVRAFHANPIVCTLPERLSKAA